MKGHRSFHLSTPGNAAMTPTGSVLSECGTPSMSVNIGDMRRLILDTGSNVWKMQAGVSRIDVKITNTKPYELTGESL